MGGNLNGFRGPGDMINVEMQVADGVWRRVGSLIDMRYTAEPVRVITTASVLDNGRMNHQAMPTAGEHKVAFKVDAIDDMQNWKLAFDYCQRNNHDCILRIDGRELKGSLAEWEYNNPVDRMGRDVITNLRIKTIETGWDADEPPTLTDHIRSVADLTKQIRTHVKVRDDFAARLAGAIAKRESSFDFRGYTFGQDRALKLLREAYGGQG